MQRFFRYLLRTLDVDAARAFYRAVLGIEIRHVLPLHESAIARGARPHWIGFLEVGDVDAAVAAFVERGAIPFGAKWVNPVGIEASVMRDPGGAIVALAKPPPGFDPGRVLRELPTVVWHHLNTNEVERAKDNYARQFGWMFGEPVDLGEQGTIHPFAWERGGAPIGSFADVSGRAGVHSHWNFQFAVEAIDTAVRTIRDAGGIALEPFVLPSGERVVVADDPQGATFALRETRK